MIKDRGEFFYRIWLYNVGANSFAQRRLRNQMRVSLNRMSMKKKKKKAESSKANQKKAGQEKTGSAKLSEEHGTYPEMKEKLKNLEAYESRLKKIISSSEQYIDDVNRLKTKVTLLTEKEDLKKVKYLRVRKFLLLAVIAVTSIAPPFFIQLDEATTILNIYKLLAKIGSLTATTLFAWQFILGFRQAAAYLITDFVWTIDLHKKLGIFASLLILLHPVFITFFYLEKEGMMPLTLTIGVPFYDFVMLGQVALIIIAVLFFTSAVFRRYMPFSLWYGIHLSSYVLLPIVFIHSFPIGTTLLNTPLRYFWIAMACVLTVFYIYRVLCRLVLFSAKYEVVDTHKVSEDTTEIKMVPRSKPLTPVKSQFVYFRRGFWKSARPYTISDYDENTHQLSITAKAGGKTSTALQSVQPGRKTYLDGPYGVFAVGILHCKRPVIMVAGGIGITPFRRVFKEVRDMPSKKFYLFYGNKTEDEIVYKEELQQAANIEIIHVISDQPDYKGEKGFITPRLMKKYVEDKLPSHEFYICGPPMMTLNLEKQLRSENVDSKHIHHELFNY